MYELDELKKNRLEELKRLRQASYPHQIQEEMQIQQQISQLEDFVRQHFTKEALSRYGNLKTAHPERAVQLLVMLTQAIQAKHIKTIDDKMLKEILLRSTPQKKEFKIKKIS